MEVQEQIQSFKHMVNQYKLTHIIITSQRLGIFDCLTEEKQSLSEISKSLNIPKERVEPLLNALASQKIISKDEDKYYLEKYKDVLSKNGKYNQQGYIDFAETIMRKYQVLEQAVKDEDFSTKNFKELTEKNAESFMKGMDANARPQAKYIAENYSFKNHKILDVGAGAGTYLITVAKQNETVTGKMIDLQEMVKIQNKKIKEENLQVKIISEECNYNLDFPKEEFDDVFCFAVVHQEPEENVDKLLKNVYRVLKTGGRLFLTSFFLNDDKISPEFAVEFSVEMLMNSNNGKVYTHKEIQNLIAKNEFQNIKRVDEIPSPATLYIAEK